MFYEVREKELFRKRLWGVLLPCVLIIIQPKKIHASRRVFVIFDFKNLVASLETQCISEERTYNVVHNDSNEIQATLSLDNPTEC